MTRKQHSSPSDAGSDQQKATPTPWRAYKHWIFDANNNHVIGDDDMSCMSNAKAELIVKAVNENATLRSSLGELLKALKDIEWRVFTDEDLEKLNSLIAKATKAMEGGK